MSAVPVLPRLAICCWSRRLWPNSFDRPFPFARHIAALTSLMVEHPGFEPFLLAPKQACCHYTRRSMLPRRSYKYPTLERKASETAGRLLDVLPLGLSSLHTPGLAAFPYHNSVRPVSSLLGLPNSFPQGLRVLRGLWSTSYRAIASRNHS